MSKGLHSSQHRKAGLSFPEALPRTVVDQAPIRPIPSQMATVPGNGRRPSSAAPVGATVMRRGNNKSYQFVRLQHGFFSFSQGKLHSCATLITSRRMGVVEGAQSIMLIARGPQSSGSRCKLINMNVKANPAHSMATCPYTLRGQADTVQC